MFLIAFVDVAVTAVIFEIPNFLYNWALDKYLQPSPPKNCKKKRSKTRTKLGSIEHHLSFVKTQGS